MRRPGRCRQRPASQHRSVVRCGRTSSKQRHFSSGTSLGGLDFGGGAAAAAPDRRGHQQTTDSHMLETWMHAMRAAGKVCKQVPEREWHRGLAERNDCSRRRRGGLISSAVRRASAAGSRPWPTGIGRLSSARLQHAQLRARPRERAEGLCCAVDACCDLPPHRYPITQAGVAA